MFDFGTSIHTNQTCTMGEALELIEDMISVDLFQARTKDRFRGHPEILCCYTQEVFSQDGIICSNSSTDS